jgi:SNF2 family DNA or RNA helicase
MARLPGAIEVRGSMTIEQKESRLNDFSTGNIRVLVTKPRVAGFGLNWQHCAHTVFAGLSFSYEQFYQATRRFWRYGQQRTVDCHVVMAETEDMIWRNIQRKANDHEAMKLEMADAMRRETNSREVKQTYSATKTARIPSWLAA